MKEIEDLENIKEITTVRKLNDWRVLYQLEASQYPF